MGGGWGDIKLSGLLVIWGQHTQIPRQADTLSEEEISKCLWCPQRKVKH